MAANEGFYRYNSVEEFNEMWQLGYELLREIYNNSWNLDEHMKLVSTGDEEKLDLLKIFIQGLDTKDDERGVYLLALAMQAAYWLGHKRTLGE
jgi:hypothetical protein